MDQAMKVGAPVIGLNDSGGARIQEGVASLGGYADVFQKNVLASGVMPQISMIMGPCAGGAVYSPAMTDFIFMVKDSSYMFVTGPEVVKTVTHEEDGRRTGRRRDPHHQERRGRHGVRERRGGADDAAPPVQLPAAQQPRKPPVRPSNDPADRMDMSLDTLVPDNPNKPYDMKELILKTVDDGDFFELQPDYAKNIIIGFCPHGRPPVGIVANQPLVLAGCLDIKVEHQGRAFRALCDAFNIPVVTFVDVPGFMPGTSQEYGGIIKHGAKLLYAYAECTVPKITVITRKAYGGALRRDGLQAPARRREPGLAQRRNRGDGRQGRGGNHLPRRQERPVKLAAREAEYKQRFANPFVAGARGFIDDVILPHETRKRICRSLVMLQNRRSRTLGASTEHPPLSVNCPQPLGDRPDLVVNGAYCLRSGRLKHLDIVCLHST